MRRSRFAEDQIVSIRKEYEADARTTDLCPTHEISEQTVYRWMGYRTPNEIMAQWCADGSARQAVSAEELAGLSQ